MALRRTAVVAATSVLVVLAAGLPFLLKRGVTRAPSPGDVEAKHAPHYYVLVPVIEVAPRAHGDSKWDAAGSAPDLLYEILWQGHTVFRSSTKKNTLLAKWSNSELGIREIVGGISLDDSIRAARITARAGDILEFRVWDDDPIRDDLIGSWKVPVENLREGDQEWTAPAEGIVAVTCRVLPLEGIDLKALAK